MNKAKMLLRIMSEDTVGKYQDHIVKVRELEVSPKLGELINKYIKLNQDSTGLDGYSFDSGLRYILNNYEDEKKLITYLDKILDTSRSTLRGATGWIRDEDDE